jgi:microcompartment protein CcmK/EutM
MSLIVVVDFVGLEQDLGGFEGDTAAEVILVAFDAFGGGSNEKILWAEGTDSRNLDRRGSGVLLAMEGVDREQKERQR